MGGGGVPQPGPAPARPAYRQGRLVGLVAVGGAVGTGARQGLGLLVPAVGDLPVAILLVNLTGAFLLGLLLEWLLRSGPDEGRRRDLRLLVGTGVLGGYTTYSALALDGAAMISGGRPGLAVAYTVGSVLLGVAAAGLGVVLAGRLHRCGGRR